jgi:5-hydroxyisourate hydrolase-like protein (transthyretin family)
MKAKYLIIKVLLLALTIYVGGCAQQAIPTGGDKDTIPPLVINAFPHNRSVNVKSQEVRLEFAELIQLNNLKQELLITPSITGDYEFEIRRNRLKLTFKEPFEANTTYTLNFRKGIKDVTEGNISENLKLVFSTGPKLDSLNIVGQVVDLKTGKPKENASVTLYKVNDTLTVFKHAPLYVTKTDKEGNYALENLRKDEYNIYAIIESNNNLKYDQAKEEIAYLDYTIRLDSSITDIKLQTSRIDTLAPKIVRRRAESNYFDIEFDEGLTRLEASGGVDFYQLKDTKIARLFNTANQYDSIPVSITAVDSAFNVLKTDIKIKFEEPRRGKPQTSAFTVKTKPANGEKILPDFSYTIEFNKPVKTFFPDSIQFLADTITPLTVNPDENFTWNTYRTELTFKKALEFNAPLKVNIPEGTFFSVEGDTSKAIETLHQFKKPSDFGKIMGTVQIDEENFIVQLLNSNFEMVNELKNKKDFTFSFLPGGTYYIRVIIDKNGNGRWDQGNIYEGILPEPVFVHPNEIKLKENWEMKENIII